MSHSYGFARWPDETVSYFEFNGTWGVATTALRATEDEVTVHWRDDTLYRACCCDAPHIEPVELSVRDYGQTWQSQACRTCFTITGKRSWIDEEPDVPSAWEGWFSATHEHARADSTQSP